MKVFFDDHNSYNEDLDMLVAGTDKYNHPIVVLPSEKDIRYCENNFGKDSNFSHVTFITYDYWLSKKWLADGEYDHIDFFRIDSFLTFRSFGVRTGMMTVRKTQRRTNEEVTE